MSWPVPLSQYYPAALDAARKEVEETPDNKVLGMDPAEWTEYLFRKWGMRPIELDESRPDSMAEEVREFTSRRYDIYSDAGPGTIHKETAISVKVAVHPSDTIEAIWKQGLAPNTFTISHYPLFSYDHRAGIFSHTVSPTAAEIKQGFEFIRSTIRDYNDSIEQLNPDFRRQLERLVNDKRARVSTKHKDLDDLAAAVGIPLKKKADPASVIPIAPRVRTEIAPLLPPPSKPQTRPVLTPDKFDAILQLVDNGGRQFERTPQSFSTLTEEGLRDILLSSLNAVYEGAAGGETFQGVGKVDIHLRIAQGEVFLAELKVWSGPESLREVVQQLRERLTWRDAYGVAIILSRNAKFTETMNAVRETVSACEGVVVGTVNKRSENHTVARFSIASDEGRHATFHVLVYNLFTESPGKRLVKRGTPRAASADA